MKLKIKSSILLILLSVAFFSCQKEFSIEGNLIGGTSVFTFAGAPTTCTNAVVSGTYQAGAALAASNMVMLDVNVTTIGTYVISTSIVNGVSFKGAGNFTVVGPQTIMISGSGIPVAPGVFSFTPGTAGCTFDVTFSLGGGGCGGTATFTLSGAPANCTGATPAGIYTTGMAMDASNTVKVTVNVTALGSYIITTNTVNGIKFSASGNFTVTGPQDIQLIGSGTPLVAGAFNYTSCTNGCTFTITAVPGVVLIDYLKCTINGVAKTFNVNLVGQKISIDTFDINGDESAAVASASFSIELKKSPSIAAGPYTRYLTTNTSTFCFAAYSDGAAMVPWVTGLSPLATDFVVNVTSYTATRITGTFSGTLYSDFLLSTGPIVITNG